jgi:4-hydroxybenzoyl-CoA thioesterase
MHSWGQSILSRDFDMVGVPMVETRAKFVIRSIFGDDILIESRVAAWRRSSFDVEHKVFKSDALAIEAWETRVWTGRHPDDPTALKTRPIPREVIERFQALGSVCTGTR